LRCSSFPEAGAGKLLLSGGNDGRVVLQTWTKSLPTGSIFRESDDSRGVEGWSIEHGRKVNCVAMSENLDRVFVADVSKVLSVYSVS
jgi:hypothetical protein